MSDPQTLAEIVKAVAPQAPAFLRGTVRSVNKGEMTCVVRPETGGEDFADVPLRVTRVADDVGFIVIPRVGAAVVLLLLDEYRAVVASVQEWDEIIIKHGDKTTGAIFRSGEVLLGNLNRANYRVVRGEELNTYLLAIQTAIIGLGGAIGPPPDFIYSSEVKVS